MKAHLTFNLDDVEDRKKHERAISAEACHVAMWEFSQYLRSIRKYDSTSHKKFVEAAIIIEKEFYDMLKIHNINLEP